MLDFNFLLLHVADHLASADLYHDLLGIPVVDRKPDIAVLPLRDGVMLGLWKRDTVEPASSGQAGVSEIAVAVADAAALDTIHADCTRLGLTILQAPTRMSFGLTFVALDPDGHRLRFYAPTA